MGLNKVERGNTNSGIILVQPTTEDETYSLFDYDTLNCSKNCGYTCNSSLEHTSPIFMTNSGFEYCSCSYFITQKLSSGNQDLSNDCNLYPPEKNVEGKCVTDDQKTEEIGEDEDILQNNSEFGTRKNQLGRSASCDNSQNREYEHQGRRVSILVDELLLKIYGDRERKYSTTGTDMNAFDSSSDSLNTVVYASKCDLLWKKYSYINVPEESSKKWNEMIRTRLMNKCEYAYSTYDVGTVFVLIHLGFFFILFLNLFLIALFRI